MKKISIPIHLIPGLVRDGILLRSVGIETLGGVFTPLIKKGINVPVEYNQIFSTAEDNQPAVSLKIFTSTSHAYDLMCSRADYLGSMQITGIPPLQRGIPQIKIYLRITDTHFVFEVSGYDNLEFSLDDFDSIPELNSHPSQSLHKVTGFCPECNKKIRFNPDRKNGFYVCPGCFAELIVSDNNLVNKFYLDNKDQLNKSNKATNKSPLEKLQRLIGLASVKQEISNLVDFIEVQKQRKLMGSESPRNSWRRVGLS